MTEIDRVAPGGTPLDAPDRLLAALDTATSPLEVRLIFDRAEALVDVAKRARVADEQLRAYVAVSLKAQRRGGELLKATPRSKGRPWHGLPTIAEVMGLEANKAKHVAENWLAVAEVPEHLFDEYVTRPGPMPSRAGLLRFRQHRPRRSPGRPRADGAPTAARQQHPSAGQRPDRLRIVPDRVDVEGDLARRHKAEAWQECVEWFARQQGTWRVVDACLQAAEAVNPYADTPRSSAEREGRS
jgi:hypothetical protein